MPSVRTSIYDLGALKELLICNNYPAVYYNEYVPALIKLSPEYTPEELKSDLNKVLKFYKEKAMFTVDTRNHLG